MVCVVALTSSADPRNTGFGWRVLPRYADRAWSTASRRSRPHIRVTRRRCFCPRGGRPTGIAALRQLQRTAAGGRRPSSATVCGFAAEGPDRHGRPVPRCRVSTSASRRSPSEDEARRGPETMLSRGPGDAALTGSPAPRQPV